jgi:hypothetical protein
MSRKKQDLIEIVRRRLGAPVVKIELDDEQIEDAIAYTRQYWIKWAVGNATQEKYQTLMLSGGQCLYNLPSNVVNVLGYEVKSFGSINTLFTVENYMYNMGLYDQILMRGGGDGYTIVSYHIARSFLDTIHRYIVDAYSFHYHKYTNQLEISPTPPSSSSTTVTSGGVLQSNTPGYILLRTYVAEGTEEDLYDNLWILDYVTAMCKVTLGRIRVKFASFSAIGSNVALSMDGDSLIQEGTAEMEKLDLTLRNEEASDSYGIEIF